MWLSYDPLLNTLYLISTYCLPAFFLAAFFFLFVFFTPKNARKKSMKITLRLFLVVLVVSALLFAAGLILFLGFVLAPQVFLFLSVFVPLAGVALVSAKFLKVEEPAEGVSTTIGISTYVRALAATLTLMAALVGAIYANFATKPQIVFPNFEGVRKEITLESSGEVPQAFLEFVKGTEEFRENHRKEMGYRIPFTYVSPSGTQTRITSEEQFKNTLPSEYKVVEEEILRDFTTFEGYIPERLRAELPRYREAERVAYASRHVDAIQPLLRTFEILGLPSDLTAIQVADSLIRWGPANSQKVDEISAFMRGYVSCQDRKYFFIYAPCLYKAADGKIYRISQSR